MTAGFVWMCQGYYRHNTGYTPEWPGFERFAGEVLHPQEWPADVDLTGKRVVVIGSGATAATLIPNIADDVRPRDDAAALADVLLRAPQQQRAGRHAARPRHPRRVDARDRPPQDPQGPGRDHDDVVRGPRDAALLPPRGDPAAAARGLRHRPPLQPDVPAVAAAHRRRPRRRLLPSRRTPARRPSSPTRSRSSPSTASASRRATCWRPMSIITATGFDLSVMGDVSFAVDGRAVEWPDTVTYRGVMFEGVPNLAYVFGYFRASWTLRADLISDFVCRLLAHVDELGASSVTPDRPGRPHRPARLGRARQLQPRLPDPLDAQDAPPGRRGPVAAGARLPRRVGRRCPPPTSTTAPWRTGSPGRSF